MRYFCILLFLLWLLPSHAFAGESYADVEIMSPPRWDMGQMQTFSGTVPSRAWLFSRGEEEVMVAVLVTEGIVGGLEGQNYSTLARLYAEAVIGGWGGVRPIGKPDGEKAVGAEMPAGGAVFCAGEHGAKVPASFGEKKFEYYTCMLVHPDKTRIVAVTTWVPEGTEEQIAARRLMTFVQAVMFR
ncbi:MAG: hypothetical protein IJ165_01125 [Proteobacteria bacterium]|nr:hypothetical protein [Pseudomonadota bacterium]